MKGSEHNDAFIKKTPVCVKVKEDPSPQHKSVLIKQKTNNAGGILGGISNGENIVFFSLINKN